MAATTNTPSRKDYIQQLTPYRAFVSTLSKNGTPATFEKINVSDLEVIDSLPGKTDAKLVLKKFASRPYFHVFKGFDYGQYEKDTRDFREHQETTLLHEIRTLWTMPPHPNIMPCPKILVVVNGGEADDQDRVCGFLQPVMGRGNLDHFMWFNGKVRLRLLLKAKWCYQMALAIQHTHQVGGTYHMDLKPGNILVDDDGNLRLIDWEQSGFSMFTHPPEITIDQEAEESTVSKGKGGRPRIIYTPRGGAPRKNQKWGFPDWNVLPEWKRTCPRAAELAEVFSLGRTMWMLLEQVKQSPDPTVWTASSRDVPSEWKDMVTRCLESDPNDRPELDEVVEFWRGQL